MWNASIHARQKRDSPSPHRLQIKTHMCRQTVPLPSFELSLEDLARVDFTEQYSKICNFTGFFSNQGKQQSSGMMFSNMLLTS